MDGIKFGCCLGTDDCIPKTDSKSIAVRLAEYGFSYTEIQLGALAQMDVAAFDSFAAAVCKDGIKIEAANYFFSGNIRLTGAEADLKAVDSYLDTVLPRAHMLGVQIAVMGSGWARNVPEGWPYHKAWEQLIGLMHVISDKALQYNMVIVIEPLNKNESNIINSIEEGYRLVADTARDNIRLLADYYHMAVENEPISHIVEFSDKLSHIHFSDPDGRRYPKEMKKEFIVFFDMLKKAGYKGRVSFECSSYDILTDAKTAFEAFHGNKQ